MQASQIITLVAVAVTMFGVIGFLSLLAHYYTLNGIKSRTVGDGQHGTARWASEAGNQKDLCPCTLYPQAVAGEKEPALRTGAGGGLQNHPRAA